MTETIDMQRMRYLNLFDRITHVQTRFCFFYNDGLVFCVSKPELSRALGRNNENLRRLGEVLRKRIKIIPYPRGIQDAKFFIELIVNPVQFKELNVTENEIIITAGSMQTKAALMGRNKKRLEEMQEIVKNYFQRELRII